MDIFSIKRLQLSKTFPFFRIKKNPPSHLIVVKNLYSLCKTDAEKYLYKLLQNHEYYPTPYYSIGCIHANLALIPYKLALINISNELDEDWVVQYLRKKHWNVIFYDEKQVMQSDGSNLYLNEILQYAPKNIISQKAYL